MGGVGTSADYRVGNLCRDVQHMCPLTMLELWLRDQGKGQIYKGDFVAHYIMPILYPEALTPRIQVAFGILIFVINVVLYAIAFRPKRPRRQMDSSASTIPSPAPLPPEPLRQ